MTKLIVAFRNFANVLKNAIYIIKSTFTRFAIKKMRLRKTRKSSAERSLNTAARIFQATDLWINREINVSRYVE